MLILSEGSMTTTAARAGSSHAVEPICEARRNGRHWLRPEPQAQDLWLIDVHRRPGLQSISWRKSSQEDLGSMTSDWLPRPGSAVSQGTAR